ncbi:unnamed protein product [Cladocopium goreaui]|uniref:Uncharacterized protein n=1 Tax=Cladocopium goreaui TaxID=2562237 RepID=A0A9P1CWK3_9DINO|nr:unnamed protein product [Cladocopium goreaui]
MTSEFRDSVRLEGHRLLRLGNICDDGDCPTTPPAREHDGHSPLGQPGPIALSDDTTEPENVDFFGYGSEEETEKKSGVKQPLECPAEPAAARPLTDVTDTLQATTDEEVPEDDKLKEGDNKKNTTKNAPVLKKRPAARKEVIKRPSAHFKSAVEPAESEAGPPEFSPSPSKKCPAASQQVEDAGDSSGHPPELKRPAASREADESGPLTPPDSEPAPKAAAALKKKAPKSANLPPFKPQFWKWEERVEGDSKWKESKHGSWKVREYVRDVGDQAGQKWRIFESGDGKTFKSFKTAANAGFIPIEDSDVD